MTEELRQIAARIESFTPGEFMVFTKLGSYKIFNNISNKFEDTLMKTIEGYELARYLNTIKASCSKNKVKFHITRQSDLMLGFYTSFNDSMIEKVELHKTFYKLVENKSVLDRSEIVPVEVNNSYCKLDIILLAYENYNCEFKVVIHLKKQLPKLNGVVVAFDELFVGGDIRKKQYNEENERSSLVVSII